MVRKCRAVSEIAVMEVDVRTTTRPPPDHLDDVVPSSANKRTKISSAGTDFQFISTTSFVKLRSRRRRLLVLENSLSAPPPTENTTRSSASVDIDASAFCCSSSNGCSEVVEESVVKFVDLEDEKDEHEVTYKSSRERRETPTPTPSIDMESPTGKSEAITSSNRSWSSVKIMAAESDLEEFFIAAEKNIQKRFTEKYNYDIVGDVPLEGRYEWVGLKP